MLSKNKAMLMSDNHKVSKDLLENPQRELANVVTTRVTSDNPVTSGSLARV